MTVAMRGDGDPATIGGDALVVTAFKGELGPVAVGSSMRSLAASSPRCWPRAR